MKATIVSDTEGEWAGLYIDGDLALEGHSLSAWHVIEALRSRGLPLETEWREDQIEDRLPQRLAPVA